MLKRFSRLDVKVKVMTRSISLQWRKHTFRWCEVQAHLVGGRTFCWNSLLVALRDRDISLVQFKRLLKTLWFV